MNLAIKDVRYNGFRQYCSLINETSIDFFRNNNYFKSIVENVNSNYGRQYYNLILKNYSEYLDKISWDNIENLSNIGSPNNNLQYTFNNKKIQVTSTILRYILFTFNILNHLKNKTDIKQLNIVEIGGGFAFQAVLLYKFAHLFDLEVLNYTVIDLEEVSNLQNLFVEKCNEIDNNSFKNFKSLTYENFTDKKTYNFAISNYALGELNTYWQNTYITNIISKIDHGYFCWNFSPANPNIHSYFTSKDIIKEEENPQTNCPPVKSYILRY